MNVTHALGACVFPGRLKSGLAGQVQLVFSLIFWKLSLPPSLGIYPAVVWTPVLWVGTWWAPVFADLICAVYFVDLVYFCAKAMGGQLDAGPRMMGKPEFGFIGHISSGRALSGPASSPGCGRWLRSDML
ncbi:hypothetical protein U1Q18_039978 [Sarracenia purpurea var. burkii]